MALFGSKKNTKKAEKKADAAPVVKATGAELSHILRHARITEKATMHTAQSVYVFDIAEDASKREVMAAVKKYYSVSPTKVRVVPVPAKVKRSMRTGREGVKKGGKKAYVFLKKGDVINL